MVGGDNWAMQKISIIMPVLNEAQCLSHLLERLQACRSDGEIIVVDGGSCDDSAELSKPYVDQLVNSLPGRAKQMNAGAAQANFLILLFLHADTVLPENALQEINQAISNGAAWGRFDVQFDCTDWPFKLIARMMNWRSRRTGICTGDQALFVRKSLFDQLGGFPEIALMEDIALSALLKTHSKPYCLKSKVTTAARRWQRHGIIKTILLMWRLRLSYFLGAHPDELARRYYGRS